MNNLWKELKRRNVMRVAVAYAVVSWVVLQLLDVLGDIVSFPEGLGQTVLILLLLGAPVVLIFSWAFEITPEGVKKTSEVDQSKSISHGTGQRINKLIIGGLVIAVVLLLTDRFIFKTGQDPVQVAEGASAGVKEMGTSIAVLPFVNLSSDPEQEYFSDGISEEILNVLVRVEGLQVASRTSAFAFKGQNPNLQEVAKLLKVDHVLEGSVRKQGNRVRITAQLIDAKTDRHLWSETYDREMTDIFEIQDDISNAIVSALKDTLGMEDLATVSVKPLTENMSAYELYLKGRELFIARTGLLESISLLEGAVEIDPNFSQAWATLAAVYSVAPFWGIDDDRGYFQLAEQAGRRALELDPEISMAYAVLGSLKSLTPTKAKDWTGAIEELNRAIELDPKNTTAWLWRGIVYRSLGFFDESIADVKKCIEIDPGYQNCNRHLALVYALVGDNENAILYYNKTLEANSVDMAEAFVSPMLKTGNRTGALLLADLGTRRSRAPIGAWIRAIENPDQISSRDRQDFKDWSEGREAAFGMPYTFYLVYGDYENLPVIIGDSDYQWDPLAKDWRKTEYFKRFAKELGLLGYWQEAGFPPHCRPVGNDDFECE